MIRTLVFVILTLPMVFAGALGAEVRSALDSSGAVLRIIDRVSGETEDIALENGEKISYGYLSVTLYECRYPSDDPLADAYALLEIKDQRDGAKARFKGWMLASSPALNALEHARYDVWALRCFMP